jgi:hypothetical protein
LWQDTGIQAVLGELLAQRGSEFPLEPAVSTATLHRLMASGSDRACEKWLADYAIPDSDDLGLHHFYRAMAWLGEELPEAGQTGAAPFAPRCVKDLIEEHLVERRRDLFSESSVSCSWTRPRSPSSAPVGRPSAGAATPRATGPS